ncbi:AMP deaminase [Arachis hypogaea]|nr:AMP deaminase [Arachis hypogaea]
MTRSFVSDSINVSRKRMDVDSLDMLQFHWWDYSNPGYLDALKHLTDLKDEGRIKTVALTNFNTERLQIILENDIPVVSNQVQHSIVDMRPQQRMAELCQLDSFSKITDKPLASIYGVEGKSAESGSFKRSLLRPTSSKSPVLSASAFESRDGSDDDDNLGDCVKLDTTYLRTSGNVGPEGKNPYESLPDHVNANGEQMAIAASSMTRSHSVCGDLHGVQPKPIAADILRKESEQEVFARLKSLLLSPSPDEVEAYVVLQECLEMRKRYVFKEAIASWEKEIISNPDPFFYTPEGKSEMRNFLLKKFAPHRDFYNVRKVDTHVHHSACMNQKHLLRFIKSKLRKEPDEVVIFRHGTYLTLKENPCGQSTLKEIFLKQDNLIQGCFLGELTKQVFFDLAASKYQMAEYRISIYGRKQSEWDQLASWIVNNDLYSENVVWLIQHPRLYNVYKEVGIVTSFQNMLNNIFIPPLRLLLILIHISASCFLKTGGWLDLVDDESKPERQPTKHMATPAQWTNVFNPVFSYYADYCYANLYTLNKIGLAMSPEQ